VNARERRRMSQLAIRVIFPPSISDTPVLQRPCDPHEAAQRFRAFRTRFHFSQRELANHLGLCRQAVNRIENCHTLPHASTWVGSKPSSESMKKARRDTCEPIGIPFGQTMGLQ